MTSQSDLHNRLAGKIVESIVRPPIESGGSVGDVMVLLESVVLGVFMVAVRLGGDEKVLDHLIGGVKQRAAEMRLGNITPEASG